MCYTNYTDYILSVNADPILVWTEVSLTGIYCNFLTITMSCKYICIKLFSRIDYEKGGTILTLLFFQNKKFQVKAIKYFRVTKGDQQPQNNQSIHHIHSLFNTLIIFCDLLCWFIVHWISWLFSQTLFHVILYKSIKGQCTEYLLLYCCIIKPPLWTVISMLLIR